MSAADDEAMVFESHYTDEELRRFRALTATQKLEWLEATRLFLQRFQPERQREIMNRLRRDEP